jgi:hypothetical protein
MVDKPVPPELGTLPFLARVAVKYESRLQNRCQVIIQQAAYNPVREGRAEYFPFHWFFTKEAFGGLRIITTLHNIRADVVKIKFKVHFKFYMGVRVDLALSCVLICGSQISV